MPGIPPIPAISGGYVIGDAVEFLRQVVESNPLLSGGNVAIAQSYSRSSAPNPSVILSVIDVDGDLNMLSMPIRVRILFSFNFSSYMLSLRNLGYLMNFFSQNSILTTKNSGVTLPAILSSVEMNQKHLSMQDISSLSSFCKAIGDVFCLYDVTLHVGPAA